MEYAKCWWGYGESRTFESWWECEVVQLLWKVVWSFLGKLSLESPFSQQFPLLGVPPNELKAQTQADTWTSTVIALSQ